jgi:integrase
VATQNLTKRSVEALKFSPSCDYFVWDQALRGFGIRVTERRSESGQVVRRKAFVVGYRPRGSRQFRRLNIGVFGPMTVDQARREALRQLAAVADGQDPLQARKTARAEATIRETGVSYLADVSLRKKPSTAREYGRLWKKHVLPSIGSKKVSSVTQAEVRRLHRGLHDTPYLANRVLAMLGAFFTFASREGLRSPHDNPAHGVEFFPEKARERFLTPSEFRRLGAALAAAEREGLPPAPQHRRKPPADARKRKHTPKSVRDPKRANPLVIAAIRLIALTGCREGEILSLRWDAVDFESGHLRLADSKTGRSVRPLGAAALHVLSQLSRFDDSPYVFPNLVTGGHLCEIKRTWFAVRHAAKLDGLRIHDLRHSFASVPATGGESLLVIRSLLGHARVATTERYAHLADDPVKRAADRAAGDIAAWMSGERTGVTPLRGRA